jgi:Tfp pilus assembly protein PilP
MMFPRTLKQTLHALGLASALAAAFPAPAQEPAAAPPLPVDPVEALKQSIDQDLRPPVGGYTYNPQGRRDPFVSLIRPVVPVVKRGTVDPNRIEGLLIQEVALKGIVKLPERQGFVAMLLGPADRNHFCKVGQRLYDGQIIGIDATTVTFRQDVTDPLSTVKTREVKKSLYASEEARQ